MSMDEGGGGCGKPPLCAAASANIDRNTSMLAPWPPLNDSAHRTAGG